MATEPSMRPRICLVCAHVYDPTAGDARGAIPAGTPFSELSDDWCCPVCSAAKPMFRER